MLSMRTLAKSAVRPIHNAGKINPRQMSRTFRLQSIQRLIPIHAGRSISRQTAAFSSCVRFREQVDEELVNKLDSELSLETEMRDTDELPAHLKEYIENSAFEVLDTPGKEEVVMTRTYGEEKIKITFSIEDINNVDDADPAQEDAAMLDEMDDQTDMPTDTQSGGATTKGAINQGRTRGGNVRMAPEDSIAPADRPELADEEGAEGEGEKPMSFTCHCNITIEKPGKGALNFDAVATEGQMDIGSVQFYKDAKLADPKNRTDEDASRYLYTGPPLGNLDEDLQFLFEKYLQERGVNTTLALFIPEYIDYKEQREYTNWLSGVKSFVQ